jgi:ribosomal protein S18 acetylase RimI-like enzyme
MNDRNEVRSLDVGDADVAASILELQRAAYAVEAELIGSSAIPQLTESLGELQQSRERWVAITRDRTVVAALAYESSDADLVISRLVVSPQHFREGYGEQLVRSVLGTVPHRRATVSTGAANDPALRLYAKLGFRELGQEEIVEGLRITYLERRSGDEVVNEATSMIHPPAFAVEDEDRP